MTSAVLIVCTGNLCRSVATEQLLRARLPTRGIELLSAGTHAEEGRPAHPLTLQALSAVGVVPRAHAAQRLVPEAVRVADLVLTATRDHRPRIVELDATAASRTFTIMEFARLLRGVDQRAGSLAELCARAAGCRGGSAAVAADDVDDPVLGDARDHERMVAALVPAVTAIGRALASVHVSA